MKFEVWAPKPVLVRLDLDGTVRSMTRDGAGWWRTEVEADAGARYGYLLDDDPTVLPDPRSARQPEGVHARSQVHRLSPSCWTDEDWTGRSLPGAVIYELH